MGHGIDNVFWARAYLERDVEPDVRPSGNRRPDASRHEAVGLASVARRELLVFAIEDQMRFSPGLQTICEFLGIKLEQVNSHHDLAPLLRVRKPMAVFCELDSPGQDGCHIMKIVAEHDRTLPVLVVTGDDSSLLGATEAVVEISHLTSVTACRRMPAVGELVEFLFSAGRKGRCLSLMPS